MLQKLITGAIELLQKFKKPFPDAWRAQSAIYIQKGINFSFSNLAPHGTSEERRAFSKWLQQEYAVSVFENKKTGRQSFMPVRLKR